MRPNGRPKGGGRPQMKMTKESAKTLKRLLAYIMRYYKGSFILVLICIVLSALANVANSLFIKTLIDDYIEPMLSSGSTDFSGLIKAIAFMAGVFFLGISSTFAYTRIMVNISQGVLKKVRVEMFDKMQSLPIRYFDVNTHGDIMSHYTNDTDTLRQMISQSIPQFISSAITVVSVFIAMVSLSIWLTLLILAILVVILIITAKIGGNSGKYFATEYTGIITLTFLLLLISCSILN